ncbi:hypothetical protein [Nocardia transvalensis]|uniref:hypothetical protein n=1 Tax=Nocardia transvalensis TaxID=37333 RepID=UPI001892E5EE|nr:hypothetical protein [Nocardia transvalensis]MBF6333502.1 hypothetical protein [Nocardia transvalensis]
MIGHADLIAAQQTLQEAVFRRWPIVHWHITRDGYLRVRWAGGPSVADIEHLVRDRPVGLRYVTAAIRLHRTHAPGTAPAAPREVSR